MQLTPKQLKQFDELGYFVMPDCFSEEDVAVLRAEAEGIFDGERPEVWREKSGAPRTACAPSAAIAASRVLLSAQRKHARQGRFRPGT